MGRASAEVWGRSMWGTVLGKGQETWAVLAPVVRWGEVGESRRCWKEREMRNSWPPPWHKVAKPTPWPMSYLRVPAPCLKHELQRGLSCLGQERFLFCCFQTYLWAPPPRCSLAPSPRKEGWLLSTALAKLLSAWTTNLPSFISPCLGLAHMADAYLTCVGWINTHVNIESYRAGISKTFLKRTR